MLQSTWMDLVLGVDIHIMLVPTPAGPVPTPLPHPFTGLVLDPMGAAMNAAMGGGVVLVNGLFVTNCGTGVMNIPPHLPVPGPFAKGKPENDAELWLGALNVSMGGSLAVRLGEIALSCSDPVRMPTSVVIAIPKGPLVIVPRPPVPDLATIAGALGFKALGAALKKAGKLVRKFQRGAGSKFFKKVSKRLRKNKPKSRAAQKWNKAVCFLTGHPVDVATGRLITGQVELELTGALPLRFERNYDTASSGRQSPFGRGWSHSYDEAVWVERGAVVYRNEDGREIEFSTLGLPDRVLSPGNSIYEPCERLTLEAHSGGTFIIRNAAGISKHFGFGTGSAPPGAGGPGAPPPGGPRADTPPRHPRRVANLVMIMTRSGVAQRLAYDEFGRLASVTDDAGRVLSFEYERIEAQGAPPTTGAPAPKHNLDRVCKVSVRGSDGSQHLVGSYEYDPAGDLVTASDALGHAYRYEYESHLLVRETDKNGLSFYFQYDGVDASAKCVRTWGDGGIYDHVITYDTAKRITLVESSLGESTLYQMDEAGQVISVTDPAGRVTKYEYDDDSGQVAKEIDPAGGAASRQYDARGNLIRLVGPDGAAIVLEYGSLDLPEHVVDALGNDFRWSYDLEGQLLARTDPLGRHTQFRWNQARLEAVIDPAGQETRFEYDSAGNLGRMLTPDGAESRWEYDGLARVHTAIDPNGNRQTHSRDALGRVTLVHERDGNQRALEYDPQSNVIRARDVHHDVRFEYRSVGRLSAREQNGARIELQYDSEDRLLAIRNEHGSAYRFLLGPGGDVLEEHGFDGLRRRYIRDSAGRVTEVRRPLNRTTKYAYDAAGRVTVVVYDDGSKETYGYRPDGELSVAANAHTHLELERDALGSVIEERQDSDWIRSEYDALGLRKRATSSKGFAQTIRRNSMGDVLEIEAGVHSLAPARATGGATPLAQGPYRVSFERDRLGLELERRLPGGVRARWRRDSLGRPITHEITVGGAIQGLRQYKWEPNQRLKSVIDGLRGPTHYSHDAAGNLASAAYPDGQIDLRLPDAVGNLFKSPDKADRKYGPAGELLESTDARGITRYRYDAEGYLIEKIEPGDHTWKYHWNGAGMLARVERPDGNVVEFAYDPLGRRISKTYRGKTTRWLWDGNVPLHEWVELTDEASDREGPTLVSSYEREIAAAKRDALLARRSAQGPPGAQHLTSAQHTDAGVGARDDSDEPLLEGTRESPITWLFEPESFAPLAKLVADERYSIVTDHLGTPRVMFDIAGEVVWSAEIDAYGDLRELRGPRRACPFRWPGQYEDVETGLYYNRYRYYDPNAGQYVSQDPLGLRAGLALHRYTIDPLKWADPYGLAACVAAKSRREAMEIAEQHAQVPRVSKGGTPIGFDELNASSRGRNANALQGMGVESLGRRDPSYPRSPAQVFDHPDGHPHQVGPAYPAHHASPHVHAVNQKGEELIVTYPGPST